MKILIIAFFITLFAQLLKAEEDVISPGDILHLKTPYNDGQFPRQRDALYIVDPEGNVNFGAGLGVFQAKGQSAKAVLLKLTAKGFTKKASKVSLSLLAQVKGLKEKGLILVVGEIKIQKEGEMKAPLTLEEALEKVGGTTPFAAINRIGLIRDGKTTTLDLRDQKAKPQLVAGDLLFIPQKRWVGR